MNITDIQKPYDNVFSLGQACQTAYQLKRNNLRKQSGPLDWFITPTKDLILLLENKFTDFMSLENLRVTGVNDHSLYTVRDTKYNCISMHDFQVSQTVNEEKLLHNYPSFKQKLDRRINYLINEFKKNQSILFVRTRVSYEEALKLTKALEDLGSCDIYLLIVNYSTDSAIVEHDWGLDKICTIEIPFAEDRWEGCNTSWSFILNGISL